jgi:hypothetical protein
MMKVDSDQLQEGYVIVPLKMLDDATAQDIADNQAGSIISKKEMVAMYTSTVMEINRGDNSSKSLNVKLYNCLAPYAQSELDAITKRILK